MSYEGCNISLEDELTELIAQNCAYMKSLADIRHLWICSQVRPYKVQIHQDMFSSLWAFEKTNFACFKLIQLNSAFLPQLNFFSTLSSLLRPCLLQSPPNHVRNLCKKWGRPMLNSTSKGTGHFIHERPDSWQPTTILIKNRNIVSLQERYRAIWPLVGISVKYWLLALHRLIFFCSWTLSWLGLCWV